RLQLKDDYLRIEQELHRLKDNPQKYGEFILKHEQRYEERFTFILKHARQCQVWADQQRRFRKDSSDALRHQRREA
ncbi:hypothetical protein H0H87_012007, partial [Tephrocybe sp. NHM501043]